MRQISRFRKSTAAVAIAAAVLVAGCADETLNDLQHYVGEISKRKAPAPEPLPPIKPYNVYAYVAQDTDPFRPFFQQDQSKTNTEEDESGIKPDFNRNKEELEDFPLDSMRMVGTLEQDEDIWAVVLATNSTIHRVQVGNYMGQNHGKIVNIQEDRVELLEIARDSNGRWQERPASIALVEEE